MFIPPNHLKDQLAAKTKSGSKVRLKSSHLLIDREVAQAAFGDTYNIYVVYYPDRSSLMMAPVTDEVFKNLHKASQQMLKDRNLNGDKSIALHETLIDHQLNETDRDLQYELEPGLGILKVSLG